MSKSILILLLLGVLFFGVRSQLRADVLDNWTTNQISTNSFDLRHVVYGNGIYVAVAENGDGGEIYTSADGFHWALQFSDNNSWGMTLNYSGGHFAGVGGFGTVNVSADGTNWTSSWLPVFDPNAMPYGGQAITYGNGTYVTVGVNNSIGTIQTSSDGVTWISRSTSPAVGGRIASVAYGNNVFMAIGDNDGLVYTSSDSTGTTWAKKAITGGKTVSFANGRFIVPSNNKTNLTTSNGTVWSTNSTGLTNLMGMVTYGNGIYMAQCGISTSGTSGSYLAISTNRINWIQYPTALPNCWSYVPHGDTDVSLATDGSRLLTIGATLTTTPTFGFNSYVYISDILAGVRITNNPPHSVALIGLVGRNYEIQSTDSLSAVSNNWTTRVSLRLPDTIAYGWTDPTPTAAMRLYRAVLLP